MTTSEPSDRNPIPLDPDARVLYHLSVPRGTQAIIHIEGCLDLVYAVNPTDGRAPFIVMQEPDQAENKMTHSLRRVDHDKLGGVSPFQRSAKRNEPLAKEFDNDHPE